jgi:flagellar biosynthesis protein FlhG
MADSRKRPKGIWAVGGGKGGTGKTLIASNMAVYLAKLGHRVLLVDADFGGANLHTFLDLRRPSQSLEAFFSNGQQPLEDLVEATNVSNLFLVTCATHAYGRRPSMHGLNRFKKELRSCRVDYVILDVASGSSQIVIDLFLMGEIGIYVMLPEPTSIENTYQFIKETLYWDLVRKSRKRTVKGTLYQAFHQDDNGSFLPVPQLLERVDDVDPKTADALKTHMDEFCVRLVVNQVRRYEDVETGFAVRSAIHKYFGVRVDLVGYINHDDHVLECVRMRKPLMQNFPDSNAAKCIENLTHKLLTQGQLAFDFYGS